MGCSKPDSAGRYEHVLPPVHYRGNGSQMSLALSKITAQGQVSVPAEVRRKLGVGPGSMLQWDEEEERIVVRRTGRYTSEEIHRALFPKKAPASRTLEQLDEGVRRSIRKRYARR